MMSSFLMNFTFISMSIALSGNLVFAQNAKNPCVKLRIGLDIGSGSSKFRSAIVDACKQVILVQIYKDNAAVPFKANLNREGSDHHNFDSKFLTDGVATIASTLKNVREITQAILTDPSAALSELASKEKDEKKAAKILKSIPKMIEALKDYQYLANVRAEVAGVATEAFRQADDRGFPEDQQFGRIKFGKLMRDQGMRNVTVLTQTQEGHVGFIGVLADPKLNANPKEYISWDIGGASLQIVGYLGDQKWQDYGNVLASDPMRAFVVTKIQEKSSAYAADGKTPMSPNPVIAKENTNLTVDAVLQKSESFTASKMADLVQAGWFAKRQEDASALKIFGIGGVHGGILSLLQRLEGYSNAKGYSQDDLKKLLNKVLYLSDDELTGPEFNVPKAFVAGTVGNVLMVYSVMKNLNIKEIQVADVDNTLGTMVSFSSLWSPLSSDASSFKNAEFVNP